MRRALGHPGTPPACVVVTAGPGFGKSFALHELRLRLDASGPLLWLTLQPGDASTGRFFRRLLAALEHTIPGLSAAVFVPPEEGPEAAQAAWRALFEALDSYGAPSFSWIFDDVHLALGAGGHWLKALGPWLGHLRPEQRLVLASRQRLPLPLRRLVAGGLAWDIGQAELAFSLPEAEALLEARSLPVPLDLAARVTACAGWPLGLAWGATRAPGPLARSWQGAVREVVEEVLDQQDEAGRQLLLGLALLGEFDAALVQEVLTAPQAEQALAVLQDQHLVEPGDVGLRLAPHLLQGLRDASRQAWEASRRQAIHRMAAGRLAVAQRPEQALEQAWLGGDWDQVAELAAVVFPRWRFDQRQAAIAEVIEAVPEDVQARSPFWSLWEGHLASWSGLHAEATILYQEAARLYTQQEDAAGHFKALYRCLYVALIQQDHSQIATLRAAAAPLLSSASSEDRADWALAEAYCAEQAGDMAAMREHNLAVLEVAIAGSREVAASQAIALINLHTHALHAGALQEATRWIQQARAVADTWSLTSYGTYAVILEAHLALWQGQLEAAGVAFRALPADWPARLDWHDRACAHVMQAAWHQAEGAYDAAEAAVAEARALFAAAGFAQGLKLVAEREAWLAIARRQPERALAIIEPALDDAPSLYEAALHLPRCRAWIMQGEAARALPVLASVEMAFTRLGAGLHAARAGLHRALAEQQAGKRLAAEARLETVRARITEAGWDFLLHEDQALWQALGEQAQPAEATQEGLEIRLLGSFEVRRGGVRVDQWARRRPQILLAALVLYPHGLNLAELADVLGEAGAESKWRVTVSYLRQALEPGLAKGRASHYVRMVHDRYQLDPDGLSRVDVRQFETAIARARHARAQDPATAAQHYATALQHHSGELLADPFFARYFEAAREALRLQAVEAHLWLLDWCLDRGEQAGAETHLREVMALAAAEESVALAAQQYWRRVGDPTRAAQVYWDHRRARQMRFGLPPCEAVEAAHRQPQATAAKR